MKQISCANYTEMHISKETCPFVTLGSLNTFSAAVISQNTYFEILLWNRLKRQFPRSIRKLTSSIYFHRTFDWPNIFSSSHFLSQCLSARTCPLMYSLPIDSFLFMNIHLEISSVCEGGFPTPVLNCTVKYFLFLPLSHSPASKGKILVMEPLFYA